MLLSLRSLWEGVAGAVAEVVTGATRKHPKIQRKLRRLARWSEAVAPPRLNVVIEGAAIPTLQPAIIAGAVIIARHVAVYSKGIMPVRPRLAGFSGVDVSLTSSLLLLPYSFKSGEVETGIDLIRDEIMALAMLAA